VKWAPTSDMCSEEDGDSDCAEPKRYQKEWDRIVPVLVDLLELNDSNFMLNKVIEIEAPERFSTRELP
jgi:hypothetical protein